MRILQKEGRTLLMKLKSKGLSMLILIVSLVLHMGAQTPVFAESLIEIEGKMIEGRFLVPMRSIFEALNVTNIQWDGKTQTITVIEQDTTIKLTIDSNEVMINNEKITLDTSAKLLDERTYVPLRFIGESLGATVEWNSEEQVAYVRKDGTTIRIAKEQIVIIGEGYLEDDGVAYYGVEFSDGFLVFVNIDSFDMAGGASTSSYYIGVTPRGAKTSKNITILGSGHFEDSQPLNQYEYINNYSNNPDKNELISMSFYENLNEWNGNDFYGGFVHFEMFNSIDEIYFNDGIHECYLSLGAN